MNGSSYFHKVIVPVIHGCDYNSALALAELVTSTENILLVGMICVPMVETMSAATLLARRLRTQLQAQARKLELRNRPQVLVTDQLWPELSGVILEERPDLDGVGISLPARCAFADYRRSHAAHPLRCCHGARTAGQQTRKSAGITAWRTLC